jgi:hypothetical protein
MIPRFTAGLQRATSHLQPLCRSAVKPALIVVLALPAAAQDTVVTKDGRSSGAFAIRGNKTTLDDQALNWEKVASVLTARRMVLTSPNALVMRNGERWRCTIVGLHRNKLRVRIAPYGTVDVDIQLVASLVFNETGEDGGKPGRLYRTRGNPISGKLAGISASALSLNSALGVFNLDRKDVARYVMAPSVAEDEFDELTLINGSLFRGTLTPHDGELQMEHPILGNSSISEPTILYLRRHSPHWSRPGTWTVVASEGPMGLPESPSLRTRRSTRAIDVPWIEALRVAADTRLNWVEKSDRERRFAAVVIPASAHGGALLAFAGDKVLSEHAVSGDDAPIEWSFQLPAGQPLDIRFKFNNPPGMPCTVLIGDPILFTE